MNIGLVKKEQIHDCVELARVLHETEMPDILEYDDKAAYLFMLRSMTEDRSITAVVTNDDEIMGFMMGKVIVPMPFKTTVAQDCGFYVKPEHRKKGVASALLDVFILWGKKYAEVVSINDCSLIEGGKPMEKALSGYGFMRSGVSYSLKFRGEDNGRDN